MSRNKPSSNYLIVESLIGYPIAISVLKEYVPSFSKRLSELKKMWFVFEEVIDTNTGILCLDMIHIPEDTIINHDTKNIKVGNYWRDYKNEQDIKRIERWYASEFQSHTDNLSSIWNELIMEVKQFISKLFK